MKTPKKKELKKDYEKIFQIISFSLILIAFLSLWIISSVGNVIFQEGEDNLAINLVENDLVFSLTTSRFVNSIYFELDYCPTITTDDVDYVFVNCTDGRLQFGAGNIVPTQGLQFSFNVTPLQNITLTDLTVYDVDTMVDLFAQPSYGPFSFTQSPPPLDQGGDEDEDQQDDDNSASDNTPRREGTGGRGSCSSEWSCSSWSACNASKEQTRTCVDTKHCRVAKVEKEACSICEESWVCDAWSECSGTQTRTCYDEHHCGTILARPSLEKSCTVLGTNTAPSSPVLPSNPPVVGGEANVSSSNYWLYLIPVISVIALLILAAIYFFIRHRLAHDNYHLLHEWIEKEKRKGISDKIMKKALQDGGWLDEDIDKAFLNINLV